MLKQSAIEIASAARTTFVALLLASAHTGAAFADASYDAYQRLNGFIIPQAGSGGQSTPASHVTDGGASYRNYQRWLGFRVDEPGAVADAGSRSTPGVTSTAAAPARLADDASYRAYVRRNGFSG